ncbi:MAG: Trm112 family protein [Aestuariivita sp.]|nr:Trm112 family protein [Aestuariivita sp.]
MTERKGESFDRHMLEALVCPCTHNSLEFDAERQELISRAANLAFPIRDGIPVMLVDEARTLE